MDNEKVFNRNVFKAIFVVTGIILFCGGLSDENVFLTFIGLICVVVGFTGKKKTNDTSTEIQSGTTQNMPENTTTIKSADLGSYNYHRSVEHTDYCPICKERSSNGYCSKCGYRF